MEPILGLIGLAVAVLSLLWAVIVWLFPQSPLNKWRKHQQHSEDIGSMQFLVKLGDSSKEYWSSREGPLNLEMIPEFEEVCSDFFQIDIDKFVSDVDPSFDITVINNFSGVKVIHELGCEIVSVAQHMMGYGDAQAAKITTQETYVAQIPNVREIVDKNFGGFARLLPPTKINLQISSDMPDPFRTEPESLFRFELLLKDYVDNMPNLAVIRFWVKTQSEEQYSDYFYLFTL